MALGGSGPECSIFCVQQERWRQAEGLGAAPAPALSPASYSGPGRMCAPCATSCLVQGTGGWHEVSCSCTRHGPCFAPPSLPWCWQLHSPSSKGCNLQQKLEATAQHFILEAFCETELSFQAQSLSDMRWQIFKWSSGLTHFFSLTAFKSRWFQAKLVQKQNNNKKIISTLLQHFLGRQLSFKTTL